VGIVSSSCKVKGFICNQVCFLFSYANYTLKGIAA